MPGPPAPTAPRDATWAVLGGCRFLLAVSVFATHVPFVRGHPSRVAAVVERAGGVSAVLGFLVISGYSIAHSIARRPRGFLRRRAVRIYPLYVLAVLASTVPFVGRATLRTPGATFAAPTPAAVLANLLFIPGLVGRQLTSDPVVWTLSIEVALYLSAPALSRLRTRWVCLLAAVSGVAFGLYPRLGLDHYLSLPWGLSLLFLSWAWLAGFAFYRHRSRPAAMILLVGVVGILAGENHEWAARYHLATLVAVAAVTCACPYVRLPRPVDRTLAFAGDVSYPLYLFHFPVLLGLWRFTGSISLPLEAGCATAVSVAALAVEVGVRHLALWWAARGPAVEPTPASA